MAGGSKRIMKCALCHTKIMGHGHNGDPLVAGLVCGNCNLGVMYSRIPCPNQVARELVIQWCKSGMFIEELKNHERFSVGN